MDIPTSENLTALQSIVDAYFTLAGLPDSNPNAWDNGPRNPLSYLRGAFLMAATRAGLTPKQARQVYACLIDSGESVAYCVGYVISHPDTPDYV